MKNLKLSFRDLINIYIYNQENVCNVYVFFLRIKLNNKFNLFKLELSKWIHKNYFSVC